MKLGGSFAQGNLHPTERKQIQVKRVTKNRRSSLDLQPFIDNCGFQFSSYEFLLLDTSPQNNEWKNLNNVDVFIF